MVRVDWTLRRTYVFGRRLHHGLVGAFGFGISAALIFHDRRDFPWRFIPDS